MNTQHYETIDQEMEAYVNRMKKLIKKRYTPTFYQRVGNFFEGLAEFVIVGLLIVMSPLLLLALAPLVLISKIWGNKQ